MTTENLQIIPLSTPAHVALMRQFLEFAIAMRAPGANRETARAALDFEEEFEARLEDSKHLSSSGE
jgi:hypothetical protein